MDDMKQMTFIQACRTFFGMLPGETLQQFVAEMRALTPEDKAELVILFRNVGIDATKVSSTYN